MSDDDINRLFMLFHYKAEIIDDSGFLGEKDNRLRYFSLNDLPGDLAPNVMPVLVHIKTKI